MWAEAKCDGQTNKQKNKDGNQFFNVNNQRIQCGKTEYTPNMIIKS